MFNVGFSSFSFMIKKNIIRGNILKDLLACGLITYVTPELDKVGYETRPSIKAKYILGDDILTADFELINYDPHPHIKAAVSV